MPLLRKDKRTKIVRENPEWPLSRALNGINWQKASASKTLGLMAFSLIVSYDFDTAIEIGISNGFSTQMLARALVASSYGDEKVRMLISCDIKLQACRASFEMAKGLGIGHKILNENSSSIDWKKELNGRQVGLSFIDGDHSTDTVLTDMVKCGAVTQPFGFLLLHDFHPRANGGVIDAVNIFLNDIGEPEGYFWSSIRLPHNHVSADYDAIILQKRPFKENL